MTKAIVDKDELAIFIESFNHATLELASYRKQAFPIVVAEGVTQAIEKVNQLDEEAIEKLIFDAFEGVVDFK